MSCRRHAPSAACAVLALVALAVAPNPAAAAPAEAAGAGSSGKGVPMRAAASAAARGAVAAAAPASAATGGTSAAAELDPMERLRLRLAERLATRGSQAPMGGTFDLHVGTRDAAPAAVPAQRPPGRAASAEGHRGSQAAVPPVASAHAGAKPAAPTAEDIGRGQVEGIAWSRPAAVAVAPPPAREPAGTAGRAVPSATRRAAAAAATGGKVAAGAGAHAALHWGYEGVAGPAAWGALRPEFNLCANGQRQSPIDIRGGLAVDLEPVQFHYKPSAFAVIDNGHTVQVNLPPGNAIETGGRRYELVQFHFHRPSEERIDGRQFEMSLHLVHKDANGRLAVVAVLLGRGPAHPLVQSVWNNLPLERHEEAAARGQLDPMLLLPEDRRYFTYMGSLTTPPCSEGVLWVVMRTPVTVTAEQVELFARLYPMNARPAQPLAGRRIMQSR